MTFRHVSSWLPFAGILVPAAVVLGWLLLAFADDQAGMTLLAGQRGATVEVLSGAGRGLTLDEVARRPAAAWRRREGPEVLAGGPGEVLWVRVNLQNPGPRPLHGVLASTYAFVDRVEAWVPEEPDGAGKAGEAVSAPPAGWQRMLSGEAAAAVDKALRGREIAFPVTVPARGGQVIYLRAEDYFRVFLRLAWWPEQGAFHAAKTGGLLAEAAYLGGLLALLGYNILLWMRLRLPDIGWYVLYLGMIALFMLLGRAHLPALGWALGSPVLEMALCAVLAAGGFFLAQFARTFLEMKERLPRCDRVARGLAVLMLGLAAAAASLPWQTRAYGLPLTVAALAVTHAALLAIAGVAWRAGVWQARFFVLSFVCLIGCSLATAAMWFEHALNQGAAISPVMIGSALEMLLLSLAVAERFARAQQRALEETAQRRMMEEAYSEELAEEVRERTSELEEANADKDRMLVALGHDLRGPLAALTQRAELLRQRTAGAETGEAAGPAGGQEEPWRGFAADVAGGGRQMLLLIEDIVLWARLRTGVRPVAAVHAVTGLVNPVVKLHRPLAERREILLTAELPDGLAVRTDLVLAQTLVRNLVGNAVKFARTRVTVSAGAAESGPGTAGVRITVSDDGPGLPPAVAAQLRGGTAAGSGGMGLLLSLEIGARLGARLTAAAPEAGGTEISVVFPAGLAERASVALAKGGAA